ncbi:161_t:CDS:2, partial [Racocetra persica]
SRVLERQFTDGHQGLGDVCHRSASECRSAGIWYSQNRSTNHQPD